MNYRNFSAQEIGEMIDRLETFEGTRMNFAKGSAYRAVRDTAKKLVKQDSDCVRMKDLPPASDHPNAMVCLDIRSMALLLGDSRAALAEMVSRVDVIGMTALPEDGLIRLSFSMLDVWEE